MGSTDRILRIIATIVIVALYFKGTVSGTVGIVLIILGAVFTITSFISICPLYLPFGISTRKIKEK